MPTRDADAAIRPDVRALAVDDERELLARNEAADAEVLNRELVLAVGRKVVARHDAAAGAERHALEAMVLRRVARREVGRFGRRLPVADGHARHARRRRGIRLEQRRRDRQRAGDVVEAVARSRRAAAASPTSIRRSSRSRMALAYSVRFRRCSTTDPGSARGAAVAIDLALRASRAAPRTRPATDAARRAAASRRRAACGPPSPTARRGRRPSSGPALQRQVRGLDPIVVAGDAVPSSSARGPSAGWGTGRDEVGRTGDCEPGDCPFSDTIEATATAPKAAPIDSGRLSRGVSATRRFRA